MRLFNNQAPVNAALLNSCHHLCLTSPLLSNDLRSHIPLLLLQELLEKAAKSLILKITTSLPRSQLPFSNGSSSMSIVEQAKLQHVSPCSWSTGDQEKPTVAGSHQKRTVRWAIEVGRRPRPPLLQTSILTTLTLGSTITTSLLPTLFRKPSVNGTCWTKFPARLFSHDDWHYTDIFLDRHAIPRPSRRRRYCPRSYARLSPARPY